MSKIDVWKFQSGDNFSLDDLAGYRDFFLDDLARAEHELLKVKIYAKYGVPGWRWTMIHAEAEVEESMANLKVVDRAIRETIEAQANLPEERRG